MQKSFNFNLLLSFLLIFSVSGATSAAELLVSSGTLHVTGGLAGVSDFYDISGTLTVDVQPGTISFSNINLDTGGVNTGWQFPFGALPVTTLGYHGTTISSIACLTADCPSFSGSYDGQTLQVSGAYSEGIADGFNYDYNFTAQVVPTAQAVPLPAAVWLFGTALLGLAGVRRRLR